MHRFEDSYNAQDKPEIDDKAIELLNESIKQAQKCLTHGDFHKYKEAYEQAYNGILNNMIAFSEGFLADEKGSLEMYAVKMIRYMQRIQDLRILLNKVQIDASKPLVEKEKVDGN
jgi:hypothetical protein